MPLRSSEGRYTHLSLDGLPSCRPGARALDIGAGGAPYRELPGLQPVALRRHDRQPDPNSLSRSMGRLRRV